MDNHAPAGQPNDANTPATRPPSPPFTVVGIGASAGGLAPTTELLRQLGPSPGLALVVVHHLDPTHGTGLVEILGRATAMPVALATDGALVEPDHVYVLPPNAGLLIQRGKLLVGPRVEQGGLHLPIDRFFESLARDRDGLSVGVVLSGTGFDGTGGIKAIKGEGGITMAQDASAQHAGMPQSAVATGCVDFVLPPAGLAQALSRIGAHAPAMSARSRAEPGEDDSYARILWAMRKSSGIDFASYKQSTLQRRLQRRLVLRGQPDLASYVSLLAQDPGEIGALCEGVLIHVTGFFRETEAIDALGTQVFPKLCEGRGRDTALRVWVPGCSTGEEVYSIAIALIEYLGERGKDLQVKLFGTDLSVPTIERARAGRYGASISREVSPERLARFFVPSDGGYQIRRDVRDLCVFARHDVTRDPPFSAMDLISCRNLMIYLGPALQDRVIGLLHYALREPGFLVLGSTETARAHPGFSTVDGKNKIYARTSAAARLPFDFSTPQLPYDSTPQAPDRGGLPRSAGPSDVHREADRLVLAEFAPPGVVVTDDLAVVQFRGQTGAFLEPTPGAASLDLMRLAREELRLPLRRTIDRARASQSPAREPDVTLLAAGGRRGVALEVIPFAVHSTQQRYFLVLFEDVAAARDAASLAAPLVAPQPPEPPGPVEGQLRQELASTRQYLESVIEQLEATNEELKAANEEIVSSNEELRSTNEELQSAKEELQATNEELRTVNEEMAERNVEAIRLSDDLTNVLNSVEIPILIVGRDQRLRRFTPAAAKLFGLLGPDVGRHTSQIPQITAIAPRLRQLLPEVLESLRPTHCTVQDATGRWFLLSVRPYVTLDGRIDGTVVAARDVDAEKRGAEHLAAARKYAEDIVETIREGLVVLDRDQRVVSANRAFRMTFRLAPQELAGRRLEELGRAELSGPELRALIREVAGGAMVEDLRLHQGEGSAARTLVLNARHVEGTELTLLAFDDVADVERVGPATPLLSG